MNSITSYVMIIGFVAVLLIPVLEWVHPLFPQLPNTENRALATFPSVDSSHHLLDFPASFDTWYQDHFSLRNQLLHAHQSLSTFGFRKSGTQRVIMGKDDWLFSGSYDWLTYQGAASLSALELKQLQGALRHRKNAIEAQNCRYYLVIAPNKYSIYPEYTPDYLNGLEAETVADQVVAQLSQEPGLNVLDLRPILRASKNKYPGNHLYFKHDSHWNMVGAFIAYEAIIEMLKQDFPDITPIPFAAIGWEDDIVRQGDYARMMGLPTAFSDTILDAKDKFQNVIKAPKKHYPVPKEFAYKDNYEFAYTSCDTTGQRLLLIRDSFGSFLIPYLSSHFDKSVYIFDGWKYRYKKDIVEQEKPTVYIDLVLESSLYALHRHRWANLLDKEEKK